MATNEQYAYPDYAFWMHGKFGIITECKDDFLNRIFQEEISRCRLDGLDITLQTPEDPDRFSYKAKELAHSGGNYKEGYWVEVTISPRGLTEHFTDGYSKGLLDKTVGDALLEKYADLEWYDVFRKVVRRQLLSIKFGLVDDMSRVDSIIDFFARRIIKPICGLKRKLAKK